MIKNKGIFSLATASLLALTLTSVASAQATNSLSRPRLLVDRTINPQGRSSDPLVQQLQQETIRQAELDLLTQPVKYELVADSLLTRSRNALGRILNLGSAYRITNDVRYANRMKAELAAMAAMPNWYPTHFLGTAEMTTAAAIGYDWLYNELTPAERMAIRTAIVSKGLNPGFNEYKRGAEWTQRITNWPQVCGSGLGIGALAVMDTDPVIAGKVLAYAIPGVRRTVADYLPAGIPSEGPVYWRYGMNYQTMFNRSLVNIYGTRQTVLHNGVYAKTAWYPASILGPSGKNFNFADASETFVPAPATLELARVYRQPAVTNWTRDRISEMIARGDLWREEHRLSALFLEWMPRVSSSNTVPPLDQEWKGDQTMVTMRSSWNDSNALYIGIKAGQNGLAHGQLDLGSFVLDSQGQRFSTDLGKDSYSLPGYFNGGANGQRWSIYRNTTRSHSTITFNNANQIWNGSATTELVAANTFAAQTRVNLTGAYAGQATSVNRTFTMINRSAVEIRDEVKGAKTGWQWQMVTTASVELGGNNAQLTINNKRVRLTIVGNAQAYFEVGSTTPPTAAENQNAGTRILMIRQPAGDRSLAVRIEPIQ